MFHQSFSWGRKKFQINYSDRHLEILWLLGLLVAAVILFSVNLGGVPLRDWDEGTVAQVAREIYTAPANSLRWLYPTIGGEPYLNKPPLMHILIALAYRIGGVNEWTSRMPGAMLTAISVPILYKIGREIFPTRAPAIFTALIYLNLLPVVRHGRLAMLDGAVLCFFILMTWCVLRSRRDLRWALGAGISFGLICLTKGMMGFLLGAIAVVFLSWDTPRLLTSGYLWTGLLIGSAPVIAWYSAQWLHYGQKFISYGLGEQSFQRIWTAVEKNEGPPWYYVLEILKYSWPWLLFFIPGLRLATEHKNLGWAKLVLVWFGVYLVAISVMGTKLPWYVLPIYPAIALAGGAYLAEVINWPVSKPYPRPWIFLFTLLAVVAFIGSLYFAGIGNKLDWNLHLVMLSMAMTFCVVAILIVQRDLQFIGILFWGSYVSLLLFMTSPDWVWELNEAYPVKPVANMINQHSPAGQKIYTSFPSARPSLDFYTSRQIIPASSPELQQNWQVDPQPYFLLPEEQFRQLSLKDAKPIDSVETLRPTPTKWLLVKRER